MSLEAGADRAAAGRLGGVQLMRAAAAVLVVVGHSQTAAATLAQGAGARFSRGLLLPWGAGVDLFFVISGFIMVYASRKLFGCQGASAEFLKRRLVRVVPLYWLCTLTYLAIIALAHAHGASLSFSLQAVAASLAFIPYPSYGHDGGLFPVFDLGWTLNYEMFFYALFAGFVFWRRRWAVPLVVVGLGALVLAGQSFAGLPAPVRFWTQPIVLEFGLGVAVGGLRCADVRWPVGLRALALGLGVAVFLFDPLRLFSGVEGATVTNGWPRVVSEGLPAALVLAALVLGTDRLPRALSPVARLGDASYSLYLIHPFVLIVLEKIEVRARLVDRVDLWAFVVLAVLASIAASLIAYRFVEAPLTHLAQRLARGVARGAPARPILAAAPETAP